MTRAQERKVGCEGDDGLIRAHKESETCDVCDGGEVLQRHVVTKYRDGSVYVADLAPSAPVGVEGLRHEAVEALRDAWKLGRQDRFLDSAPLVERIVKAALAQQPAAVDTSWLLPILDAAAQGKSVSMAAGDAARRIRAGEQPAAVDGARPVEVTDSMVKAACGAYVRDPRNDAEHAKPGTFHDPSEHLQWHCRRMSRDRFEQFMRAALTAAIHQDHRRREE